MSGVGFPLTQLVIRRYGKPGAVAVEVLCGALLVRVATMIAAGTPDRLRRGPAVLLWLEAASAGAAVLTGLRPLVNADATHRAGGQRPPDRLEVARRTAIGALAVRVAHLAVPDLPATRIRAQTQRTARCVPVSA